MRSLSPSTAPVFIHVATLKRFLFSAPLPRLRNPLGLLALFQHAYCGKRQHGHSQPNPRKTTPTLHPPPLPQPSPPSFPLLSVSTSEQAHCPQQIHPVIVLVFAAAAAAPSASVPVATRDLLRLQRRRPPTSKSVSESTKQGRKEEEKLIARPSTTVSRGELQWRRARGGGSHLPSPPPPGARSRRGPGAAGGTTPPLPADRRCRRLPPPPGARKPWSELPRLGARGRSGAGGPPPQVPGPRAARTPSLRQASKALTGRRRRASEERGGAKGRRDGPDFRRFDSEAFFHSFSPGILHPSLPGEGPGRGGVGGPGGERGTLPLDSPDLACPPSKTRGNRGGRRDCGGKRCD